MRVAMIAYTPYEMDARVKRAAEALAERGHHVDVFAISQDGVRRAGDTRLLRFYRLRMRKQSKKYASLREHNALRLQQGRRQVWIRCVAVMTRRLARRSWLTA